MRHILQATIIALGLASPTRSEVVHSGANRFESRHVLEVAASPSDAMARFGNIAEWWNPDHTYSGKAENLRLTLTAGDCFCETLANGGGVEHMRVAYVAPGERLAMTGGLGPLLYEATAGVMDVQFAPAAAGTKVTVTYRVAGFAKGSGDTLAPLVDKVLAEQIKRYEAYAGQGQARSSVTNR